MTTTFLCIANYKSKKLLVNIHLRVTLEQTSNTEIEMMEWIRNTNTVGHKHHKYTNKNLNFKPYQHVHINPKHNSSRYTRSS